MEFESITVTSGVLETEDKLRIGYDLYTPITGLAKEFPVIIFIHGFKGFKDWGPFPDACEEISRFGFGVLAINLSKNGIGENKTKLDREDLFAESTVSRDLDDIGFVIDALKRGKISTNNVHLNTDQIGLIGHSRGGHTAILAAAEFETVQCLVTWSAFSDYLKRFSEQDLENFEKKGFTIYENSRTGQKMKVNKSLYEDLKESQEKLTALNRVKDLRMPCMFIHGRKDETVPYTESEQLHIHCAAKDKELRIINGATHTYGASHPFEEMDFPKPFKNLIDHTVTWFSENTR